MFISRALRAIDHPYIMGKGGRMVSKHFFCASATLQHASTFLKSNFSEKQLFNEIIYKFQEKKFGGVG